MPFHINTPPAPPAALRAARNAAPNEVGAGAAGIPAAGSSGLAPPGVGAGVALFLADMLFMADAVFAKSDNDAVPVRPAWSNGSGLDGLFIFGVDCPVCGPARSLCTANPSSSRFALL